MHTGFCIDNTTVAGRRVLAFPAKLKNIIVLRISKTFQNSEQETKKDIKKLAASDLYSLRMPLSFQ